MNFKIVGMIFAFSSLGFADILVEQPIPDLFAHSDVVFVGQATGVHRSPQNGGTAGRDWTVEFAPVRMYKGEQSLRSIPVLVSDFNPSWGNPLNVGETALVFASQTGTGKDFALTGRLSFLAFKVSAKSHEHLLGLDGFEADAIEMALEGGESSKQSLELLARFPTLGARSVNALAAHSSFGDPQSEAMRLELLARTDPHRYLSDLAAVVSYRDAGEIGGEPLMFHIVSDLSGTGDIEALKVLANGNSKAVRLTALLGLRRLKDHGTIEFLVGKLRAGDSEEAYESVMGLAETTGRMNLATDLGTFESEPLRHIEPWEKWWRSQNSTLSK